MTLLGFALAKECIDVLDGLRVGVRVKPPASALMLLDGMK